MSGRSVNLTETSRRKVTPVETVHGRFCFDVVQKQPDSFKTGYRVRGAAELPAGSAASSSSVCSPVSGLHRSTRNHEQAVE